ncbi:MAG: dihydrofolate reductase [Pseudomonadota bacterium]
MDSSAKLVHVVAFAKANVIGADGDMPWRLSTDLKRFKALTTGKPVIMGRKTFESIGKPLPGRHNIVVTRDTGFVVDGVDRVSSLPAALANAEREASRTDADEICIIGGGEIFRQTIDQAEKLYVTHIDAAPEGDTHYPTITDDDWKVLQEEQVPRGEKDSADTRFVVYERR